MSEHKFPVKIGICVFNRATYSRCASVIDELEKNPKKFNVVLYVSSSLLDKDYGEASVQIDDYYSNKDNVEIVKLPIEYKEKTLIGSCYAAADVLSVCSERFNRDELNAVVVVADRFETLPAAMAATYQNIPLIHL